MNPTIQVTINPGGSAREIHPMGEEPVRIEQIRGQSVRMPDHEWRRINATLRTFEIEYQECTCSIMIELIHCAISCDHLLKVKTHGTHTAEILPNNKVKILS